MKKIILLLNIVLLAFLWHQSKVRLDWHRRGVNFNEHIKRSLVTSHEPTPEEIKIDEAKSSEEFRKEAEAAKEYLLEASFEPNQAVKYRKMHYTINFGFVLFSAACWTMFFAYKHKKN